MEPSFDLGSTAVLDSPEEPPDPPPSPGPQISFFSGCDCHTPRRFPDDLPVSVAAALHRGIEFQELVRRLLRLARARR